MAGHEKIKREFEDFAKKIAKLELLGKDLRSLDTRGFNLQEKSINAKLKDPNAIPQITAELNSLKDKIRKKETERIRVSVKRKIVKHRAPKKQLSKKEVKFVKDIPRLKRKIKNLDRDFEQHTKVAKVRIDTGVGLVVDEKFGNFISGIKAELTRKLKEKEISLDKELRKDLKAREGMFAERYKKAVVETDLRYRERLKEKKSAVDEMLKDKLGMQETLLAKRHEDLVDEFHKKYVDKVHSELREEVKRNFDVKLATKLENEKRRMVDDMIREDVKRLATERKSMSDDLKSQYDKKEKILVSDINRKEQELKARLKTVDSNERKVSQKIRAQEKETRTFRRNLDRMKERELNKFRKIKEQEERKFENVKKEEIVKLRDEQKRIRGKIRELGRAKKKNEALLEDKLRRLEDREGVDRKEILRKSKELEKDKKNYDKRLSRRKLELEKRFDSLEEQHKKRFEGMEEERKKRFDSMEKERKKKVALEENKLNVEFERLREKQASTKESIERQKASLGKEIRTIREREKQRVEKETRGKRERFINEMDAMRKKLKKEFRDKAARLVRLSEQEVESRIRRKEKQLQDQFKIEYDQKLREELKRRKVDLERKKVELEKHIIEHARRVLG